MLSDQDLANTGEESDTAGVRATATLDPPSTSQAGLLYEGQLSVAGELEITIPAAVCSIVTWLCVYCGKGNGSYISPDTVTLHHVHRCIVI